MIKTGSVLVVIAILTGCSSMKGGDASVDVQSSKEVLLSNVSVKQEKGLLHVSGMLRPRLFPVRRVGHVDVELLGDNGEVLRKLRAEQHIHTFVRNSSRMPTFSAVIATDSTRVKTVRLIHHADTQKVCEL